VADAKASFAIDLNTTQLKGAAGSAVDSLVKLQTQIADDTKALRDMQSALGNLQKGTVVNVQQFRTLKDAIDKKKQSIAQSTSSLLDLGGGMGKTAKSSKSFREKLQGLAVL
jgi:predicted  nucleic acid-binding Zn-ribbon protein